MSIINKKLNNDELLYIFYYLFIIIKFEKIGVEAFKNSLWINKYGAIWIYI